MSPGATGRSREQDREAGSSACPAESSSPPRPCTTARYPGSSGPSELCSGSQDRQEVRPVGLGRARFLQHQSLHRGFPTHEPRAHTSGGSFAPTFREEFRARGRKIKSCIPSRCHGLSVPSASQPPAASLTPSSTAVGCASPGEGTKLGESDLVWG